MKQGQRATGYGLTARTAAVVLSLLYSISALAKDDFLRPEDAYKYTTRIENDRLIVTWNIEKGYYLYKKKMGVALQEATSANSPSPAPREKDGMGVSLAEPLWPKGESHSDEYFGEQEIYRGNIEVPVPITFQGARPKQLALQLAEPLPEPPTGLGDYNLELSNDGQTLTYTFETERERTRITSLLRALNDAGIVFSDLHTSQSSLEDIFVDLVRSGR